jgi:phosphate transport system substrate-binding protein
MDIMRLCGGITASASLFAVAAVVRAQPADTRPMVEWIEPALATHAPQTEEEAKKGQQLGRTLPPPEILQPTLDPALPAFHPRNEKITGNFKGAASDVLKALVEMWFEKFKTYHPEVTLTISPPYAGSLGAVELAKGGLDFVFVSRELRPDDIKAFRARFDYDPLSIPISGGSYRHFGALDAIAFYVNKSNPIDRITFDQLDAMYSSTRLRGGKPITRWGDLGLTGEWADKPVKLYGIKPWNGFEEFVRQRILSPGNKRGEWRDDISFDKVVFPIAKKVADDPNGIGYSGIAYIDAGVKVLPVAEAAGTPAQAPTYENVALATYPLSRLTYFNTNKAPGRPLDPALEEFLNFILSREGQQVVLDQAIYLPLRADQLRNSRAMLSR